MTKKNPDAGGTGASLPEQGDAGRPSRNILSLQWTEKHVPIVIVSKDGPLFRVNISPPIPEDHPNRRPQTFASLATAEREAAIIARMIGGAVVSNAGGHG